MCKMFELTPIDGRKSFYGKAHAVFYLNERRECVWECHSYGTLVCSYNSDKREFTRLWSGYSVTTMRHVNAFLKYIGMSYGGKNWWDTIPVNRPVKMI